MSRRRDQGIVLEPFPQDPPPLPAPKPARCTCDRCPTPGGPPMSTDRPATTDQQPKAYGATQTESFEMTNRVASAWNRALDAGAQLVDPTGIELSPEVFAAWWEAEARRIALRVTRELAEIGAARVSEAAGDAQSPTPDVGAAQGGEGGSAAESEPPVYLVETLGGRWGPEFDDLADARVYAEYCQAAHGDTRIVRVTREVIQ